MDYQEIRTLKILEEMDKDEIPSQRHIARELDISLGLVNSFIKRLVSKGYFKVTHIPANRVKYILTPKGAAEKARLTYVYIKYSFDFYKTAREKLRDIIGEFARQGGRRIIFWGATDLAEIAYISLLEFPVELVGVVDETCQVNEIFGVSVVAKDELPVMDYDQILVTSFSNTEEAVRELIGSGVSRDKILLF